MTPEFWAIISVGVALLGVGAALATLMLSGLRTLRNDMNVRMDKFELELGELRKDQARLDNRMAHLEGLLEGLREAIVHNRAA